MPTVPIYFTEDLHTRMVAMRDELNTHARPGERTIEEIDSLVRIACVMFLILQGDEYDGGDLRAWIDKEYERAT